MDQLVQWREWSLWRKWRRRQAIQQCRCSSWGLLSLGSLCFGWVSKWWWIHGLPIGTYVVVTIDDVTEQTDTQWILLFWYHEFCASCDPNKALSFFILFSLFYLIPVLLPCYLSISSPSLYDFQQSKDEEGVASAETLKQKMKGLFSREGNVEPSSDGADYQNSPEKAVAKTRTVSTKQIFAWGIQSMQWTMLLNLCWSTIRINLFCWKVASFMEVLFSMIVSALNLTKQRKCTWELGIMWTTRVWLSSQFSKESSNSCYLSITLHNKLFVYIHWNYDTRCK